ncbi:TPA: ImmA/IrrE family metallo-endopeptidase [Clostridioides difficile]|uniref:ImmA/IrrE family metallo-endopeptidase n=1 Tax=Clostridioides difficile TaxID=1496 RepID=A0AAN6A800_CLODI|nr:ImmA/IrrE family metallo-endopeptidase [Clostridioides difficile]HBF3307665.1 ImmA/IrrE family metallo-endopeptidase [Clostridioides difficile]HBH1544533.1 ImmA/IrrE family metallo-endopeptidase [Clostridioides difficile]
MNKKNINLINELTKDIIDIYMIEIPIKDMNNVVDKMGGIIKKDNSLSKFSDSYIRKLKNYHYEFEIVIPYGQSNHISNMHIAKSLGHLFLNMRYNIDNDVWNSQKINEFYKSKNLQEEEQVKEFALALLMPKSEFELIEENGVINIDKVSKYFNVNQRDASNRAYSLGYIKK